MQLEVLVGQVEGKLSKSGRFRPDNNISAAPLSLRLGLVHIFWDSGLVRKQNLLSGICPARQPHAIVTSFIITHKLGNPVAKNERSLLISSEIQMFRGCGATLRPKYIPYSYMDPSGSEARKPKPFVSSQIQWFRGCGSTTSPSPATEGKCTAA